MDASTERMRYDITKIEKSLSEISKSTKKINETFTFHVLSKKCVGEKDSIGVNKSHISCYRMSGENLTIFFSGNDEPIVFQSDDRNAPNYIVKDDSEWMYTNFMDWFDYEWLDTFSSKEYHD